MQRFVLMLLLGSLFALAWSSPAGAQTKDDVDRINKWSEGRQKNRRVEVVIDTCKSS